MSSEEHDREDEATDGGTSSHAIIKSFCDGCDRSCCSLAVVLPHERKSIIKATRMGLIHRMRTFQKKGNFYLIRGEICPFLKEGACSIEHVQPLNCKVFPLALTHQGKDADWGVSPACPNHRRVPHEFVEHARRIGHPLLEKHRKEGPLT